MTKLEMIATLRSVMKIPALSFRQRNALAWQVARLYRDISNA